MFFQTIENAVSCQKDLENMLSQGMEFYQRLIDLILQLKQNIGDFKTARSMKTAELCKQLGVQPPADS